MLVSFTLGNWRSFRHQATLSMIPSSERRFGWTLASFPNNPKKLLPIAAIYGANASGKTNFFKGLQFLADFIIHGLEDGSPIPIDPNRIDPNAETEPTFFCIVVRLESKVYKYVIELTSKEVISEELYQITSTGKEKFLFIRRINEKLRIAPSLASQRIHFIYEGTPDNLLFLTNAYRQKVEFLDPIYKWFKYHLIFIGTESIFGAKETFNNNSTFQKKLAQYLARYDTGIAGLKSKQLPLDNNLAKHLGKLEIGEGDVVTGDHGQRLLVTKDEEGKKLNVLKCIHTNTYGDEVSFDFGEESDGTKRLLDLLPSLILCEDYPTFDQTFIIDEVDRSLHQNLIYQLIAEYIGFCSKEARNQLIMTTHDTGLMSQTLLRRDEMWIIGNDNKNGAYLQSISEFKGLRFDTVLHKLYREGRFGGVPRLVPYPLPAFKRGS